MVSHILGINLSSALSKNRKYSGNCTIERHVFVLFCAHHLQHKVYESLVLITGDWSVGPHHQSAVHLGRQVHVLTWGVKGGIKKNLSQNQNQTKRKNLRCSNFQPFQKVLQLYAARSQPFPQPQLYKTSLTSTMFCPCTWCTEFYDTANDTRVYNSKFMWNEMRRRTVPTGSPRIWASDGRPNRNFFVSWLISCTVTDTAVKKIYN